MNLQLPIGTSMLASKEQAINNILSLFVKTSCFGLQEMLTALFTSSDKNILGSFHGNVTNRLMHG